MYRQYRVGELPDIQIPHRALIAPLQALSQVSGNITEYLYVDVGNVKQIREYLGGKYFKECPLLERHTLLNMDSSYVFVFLSFLLT